MLRTKHSGKILTRTLSFYSNNQVTQTAQHHSRGWHGTGIHSTLQISSNIARGSTAQCSKAQHTRAWHRKLQHRKQKHDMAQHHTLHHTKPQLCIAQHDRRQLGIAYMNNGHIIICNTHTNSLLHHGRY